jgi:hypothetical protein
MLSKQKLLALYEKMGLDISLQVPNKLTLQSATGEMPSISRQSRIVFFEKSFDGLEGFSRKGR